MKLTRTLAFCLLATVAVAGTRQETYTLRRTYTEGAKDIYKIASSTDSVVDASAFGGGNQNMKTTSSMTLAFNYVKVDKEKANADVTIDVSDVEFDMDSEMGKPPGMGDAPKTFKVTGKMNAFGAFSDIKIEGLDPQIMQFMSSAVSAFSNSVIFPEKAVAIGDTWEIKAPKNKVFGDTESKLTAKLLSLKDADGVKCYEIKVTGPVEMKMDPSEMAKDSGKEPTGMRMVITGHFDVDSVVLIEKDSGRLHQVDTQAKSDMKVELADMGASIPIKGTSSTIVKLSK